jgi:hypothetical protein
VDGLSVGDRSSDGICEVFPWSVNGFNNIVGINGKLPVPHLKKGLVLRAENYVATVLRCTVRLAAKTPKVGIVITLSAIV